MLLSVLRSLRALATIIKEIKEEYMGCRGGKKSKKK